MPRDRTRKGQPRQAASPSHDNIASKIIARLVGRPTPPPLRGGRRLRWLRSLERAITVDTRRTISEMAAEGWDRADALEAYREWLLGLVGAAVTQAEEHDS